MAKKIPPNEVAAEIARVLAIYTGEVAREVRKEVQAVSEEMMNQIKNNAPERRRKGGGKYKKRMKLKTSYDDGYSLKKIWYVAAPDYRLAHLLEFGHEIVRNGAVVGHANPHPHIKPAEEWAVKEIAKRAEEAAKRASK